MPGVRTEKAEEPVTGSSSDSKMASELSGSQTLSSFLGPSPPVATARSTGSNASR